MRLFQSLLIFILVTFLAACGTEEILTPPVFTDITVEAAPVTTEDLLIPYSVNNVTIAGKISDFTVKLVASSTITGEVTVPVSSIDGSWTFEYASLVAGANPIIFNASDLRGNINKLSLTILYDVSPPIVSSVTQDLTDISNPKLVITFNELLLPDSVLTDSFAIDGVDVSGATYDATGKVVILPLTTALVSGTYDLTCGGITDLATPTGNTVTDIYSFEITIP